MYARMTSAAAIALALSAPAVEASSLLFHFYEHDGGVEMTASGQIELADLVDTGTANSWGGTGIQSWGGGFDILGSTQSGSITSTYTFNAGTDMSAWDHISGPFTSNFFSWDVVSGDHSFATYSVTGGASAGLGIMDSDVEDGLWNADAFWREENASLASLGLNVGTYSIVDAVSGASITIDISNPILADVVAAPIPLPAGLPLLAGGLLAFGWMRRRAG